MAITKVTNSLVSVNAIHGTLIADNAITSVHIAQNQVTSVQIPDSSITSTQLAANSVDTAELISGSIDAIHLASDSVTTAKILNANITTAKIANNAITSALIPDGSITDTQLGSGAFTMGTITTTGAIRGPASLTIDPAAVGDNTGTVVIAGNLQVDGTTTTINSTELAVTDLNITVASGAGNASAANNAGLTIAGAGATMLYQSSGDEFRFNKPLYSTSSYKTGTTSTFVGQLTNSSGKLRLQSDADRDIQIGDTNNADIISVDTSAQSTTFSGDVNIADGIFTTIHDITTVNKFKTTNNNTRSIISMESKDSSGNAVDLRIHALGDGPRGEIYTYTNHPLGFATNNAAPQMTLDTGGRLGINQTPSTNNFTLQVKGLQTNGTDGRVAYFKGYGTATSIGTTGPTVVIQNANNTTNNYAKLSFESAGAGETVSINAHNKDHSNHYGDMAFNTRGSAGYSEKMRITANGNVGIGTDVPPYQLSMKHASGPTLMMTRTSTSTSGSIGQIIFGNNDWDSSMASIRAIQDGTNDGGKLEFKTQSDASGGEVTRFTIFRTGLSTFNGPASSVNLGGGSTGSSALYVNSTSGHTGEMLQILKNGSTRMEMSNAGKLGIGISGGSISSKLHVRGTQSNTISTANSFAAFDGNGGDGVIIGARTSSPFEAYIQSGYTPNIGTSHHYPLVLNPNGGNVGIGALNPLGKLHVKEGDSGQGSINSNFDQLVLEDDAHSGMTILSGTSSDGGIYFGDSGGNNMGQFKYKHGTNSFAFVTNNGNESLIIDASGKVGIGEVDPDAILTIGSTGYVQEWKNAKGFKKSDTGQSGANGNYNESTYINVNSYRGVCVDYYESGHYFNNGAAYYFRHSKIYVIMEGSTLRVADVVLVRSTGNRTDAIVNAPSIAVSGTGQFTITSTILSGFTHYVSVDAVGGGFVSIGSIG